MKKGKIFTILLVLTFLILTNFVQAELNSTEPDENVAKAYSCLTGKVNNATCEKLGLEDKIFSLMAIGKCKNELLDVSKETNDGICWPQSACDTFTTAKALVALNGVGANTDAVEDWLMSKKTVPKDLIWFLQIDQEGTAACTATIDGNTEDFIIDENKKILTKNILSCLTVDTDYSEYWYTIKPECYEKEFIISCNGTFKTSLLFRERTSEEIHVLKNANSAAAGGLITEKIQSYCFAEGGNCNYQGTLWGAFALFLMGEKVEEYHPYLISKAEENKEILPFPILYLLSADNEYKTRTANLQTLGYGGGYWRISGLGNYYGTAMALLPFSVEDFYPSKDTALEWLFANQEESGCWNNDNIRDTAFLLYSLWPKNLYNIIEDEEPIYDNDCEDSGYFCMPKMNCGGTILEGYKCNGIQSCCSEEAIAETCSDIGGEICSASQECKVGEEVSVSGLSYGQSCCKNGYCEEVEEEDTCTINGGTCDFSCDKGYKQTSLYTCTGGEICCIKEEKSSFASYWWIWLLFFLIIATVLVIIFRERVKEFISTATNGKFFADASSNKPKSPPSYQRNPPMKIPPRRVIPQSRPIQRPPIATSRPPLSPPRTEPKKIEKPKPKTPAELDEVLKKLKEMGS